MKDSHFYLIALLLFMTAGLISCNKENTPEGPLPPDMATSVQLSVGSQVFTISLFDNETGRAFRQMLPLTLSMDDVNTNEKFIRLPQNLPTAATNPGTIQTGDLMLYGSNGLVLFYKTFPTSYSYTRIGTVDNPSGLERALGSGSVEITFAEIQPAQRATLTYDTNGANSGSAPTTVTEDVGTVVSLANGTAFSRAGYTFAGWNTRADGSGTKYTAGSSFILNSDIILYAQWASVSVTNSITITVGSQVFTATLADNATAAVFREMLPLTLSMDDVNANEKFIRLPQNLPTAATNPGTIQTGDLMLYGSNGLVLFYKTFTTSYSYTRIGRIDNPAGLEAVLGAGSVTVSFTIQSE